MTARFVTRFGYEIPDASIAIAGEVSLEHLRRLIPHHRNTRGTLWEREAERGGANMLAHGIVSLDPPTIRCDGCGHEHADTTIALAVLTSGIRFYPRAYDAGDTRRLCRSCRIAAGWPVR